MAFWKRKAKSRGYIVRRILSASLCLTALFSACATMSEKRKDLGEPVNLPFLRMESSECYFLDEFMPTPDSLVTGKSAGLFLRYYTYQTAMYKVWNKEKIMLNFFSRDSRCWSLFEEYTTGGNLF